jgi:hypothetical protein
VFTTVPFDGRALPIGKLGYIARSTDGDTSWTQTAALNREQLHAINPENDTRGSEVDGASPITPKTLTQRDALSSPSEGDRLSSTSLRFDPPPRGRDRVCGGDWPE